MPLAGSPPPIRGTGSLGLLVSAAPSSAFGGVVVSTSVTGGVY